MNGKDISSRVPSLPFLLIYSYPFYHYPLLFIVLLCNKSSFPNFMELPEFRESMEILLTVQLGCCDFFGDVVKINSTRVISVA